MPDPAEPPELPALEAWHDNHRGNDRPRTSLWFPEEAPYVLLDTVNVGGFHDPVERLPDPDKPTAHVHLGSKIDIGGYLHEMEAYFAAVMDALRYARWQADMLAADQAEDKSGEGDGA